MKRHQDKEVAPMESPITNQSHLGESYPLNNSTTIKTGWQYTKKVSPAFLRLMRLLLGNDKEGRNDGESDIKQ